MNKPITFDYIFKASKFFPDFILDSGVHTNTRHNGSRSN